MYIHVHCRVIRNVCNLNYVENFTYIDCKRHSTFRCVNYGLSDIKILLILIYIA